MALEVREVGLRVRVKGRERDLLHPVSLKVERGSIVGLTGPSGSGKSTLLRILTGLEDRSGGRVLLDGSELRAEELPEFRSRVVLVPQEPSAPAMSLMALISEVAGYAAHRTRSIPAEHVLVNARRLGLEEGDLRRPLRELSGGERRRAHVALACSLEPHYLLLDEPGAGLDRRAEEHLADLLQERAGSGTGILLATHSERLLARTAGRLLVLYDGRLQAEGTPQEVIPGAVGALREGAS